VSNHFEVIVIGSGPAGYVCAIRCAQLGLSTALIEKETDAGDKPVLGGTCLNVGCIPSKALLDSSQRYADAKGHLSEHGIGVNDVTLNIPEMMVRKEKIVAQLTGGVAGLLKHNKITVLSGAGQLLAGRQVELTDAEGQTALYTADNVVLASGSEPVEIPPAPIDGDRVVDSTGALCLDSVPARLGVIGALDWGLRW
jgi:dihydrolipoamide dehydrogenase